MWAMYVFQAPGGSGRAVLVVDDECLPVFFGADPAEASTFLGSVGQAHIWMVTGAGGEQFDIVARTPVPLPRQVVPRPQALLVPSAEADEPIRDAGAALVAVNRFRRRRLGPIRRRHRRTEGPYVLLPG